MSRKSVIFSLTVLAFSITSTLAVHISPAKGSIQIEGHITQDTIWAGTYLLVNQTYVDGGVTLTIMPGASVEFAEGLSLVIEGSLEAVGTDLEPIIFTSNRGSPNPGDWNTIVFKGSSSEQFHLEHARITYAVSGVTVESVGLAVIEESEISNCSENGIMIVEESNVVIKRNLIRHNRNGIATNKGTVLTGIIISSNTISSNSENGVFLGSYDHPSTGYFQWIYNVSLSSNNVSSNGKNGVYIFNIGGVVYNITFYSNVICCNSEHGARLYCFNGMYNVTFSSNAVASNGESGIYVGARRHSNQTFDLSFLDNIISANHQKGIWINGRIKAEIARNSISYNCYGIHYTEATGNLAEYNDIYSNSYGVNVTLGATVDARLNYWGDSCGPYHPSLNPEGKSNPVNSDGTDLAFVPFLALNNSGINTRPVAVLSAEKETVSVNQTLVFIAFGSEDDGQIEHYFFDFGDGTGSGWTSKSTAMHAYAEEGGYNATLIVRDNFGVESLDGRPVRVTINVVPEFQVSIAVLLLASATFLAFCLKKARRSLG